MTFDLDTKLGMVKVATIAGDLPPDAYSGSEHGGWVGIDTETSGLDWSADELGLVQVFFPSRATVYLIRPSDVVPNGLLELLESEAWIKVFHYALFDLRFLASRWNLTPRNIRCTKLASKLVEPERDKHSLADLVRTNLDVELSKSRSIRVSEWTSDKLSREQLQYAALDAVYLPALFKRLEERLHEAELQDIARECFSFIPAQLRTDLMGVHDLFGY